MMERGIPARVRGPSCAPVAPGFEHPLWSPERTTKGIIRPRAARRVEPARSKDAPHRGVQPYHCADVAVGLVGWEPTSCRSLVSSLSFSLCPSLTLLLSLSTF